MLYLAGIIITFFLAIILLSKQGKTAGDHVLAGWLFVIGFHLSLFYLQITGIIYDYTFLLGIQIPMPLLHGPLLYIYTLTETRYNGFQKKYWLHFLPATLAYAAISSFFLLSPEEKIRIYKNHGEGFEAQSRIILSAIILSGFTYVLLSFKELRQYKKNIADEFSNTEKINLNWLRYLIYGMLVIWLVVTLLGNDSLIFATVVLFVLFLGYFGIKHMGIFTYRRVVIKEIPAGPSGEKETPFAENKSHPATLQSAGNGSSSMRVPDSHEMGESPSKKDNGIPEQTGRYEKSALQKEAAEKIHHDLSQLMQNEKLYKNAELSLSELAGRLQVHPNNLSQVINTYENKTFYDYINSLRIREFKDLVQIPANNQYTLLSLAFESGFNSKTSFNRNFKKITGLSPSSFLKQSNVQLVD